MDPHRPAIVRLQSLEIPDCLRAIEATIPRNAADFTEGLRVLAEWQPQL